MSVIWITGLSGSGKTTIGKALVKKLNSDSKKIIFLDGDIFREVFQTDDENKDYSLKNRLLNAKRISKLSYFLSSQGHDVIVSTISMFKEVYLWNRDNIEQYFEVLVDIPLAELVNRDEKKIYSKFKSGELINVVGMDQPFDKPPTPEYIIKPFVIEDLDSIINDIILKSKKRFTT